jgi:hypothetical protein
MGSPMMGRAAKQILNDALAGLDRAVTGGAA